jgi:dihydroorotate dehydrogenase (NAD+) catalytic subunit
MRLTTNIGKLNLKNPIICASGTFGFGIELKDIVDFNNLGAFVTKTLTLNQRQGNLPPRIVETTCGVLNSIGLENPGIDGFIKDILPQIKKLNTKFIVSIGGSDLEEYREITRRLRSLKEIEALEVNLSCPNIKMKKMISQSARVTYRVVKSLRSLTNKVLIVKITGEVEDIVKVAKAIKDAGADAISLVNTFYGLAIDINTKRPYLGSIYGGYSGRGIKPLSLYRVWQVAKNIDVSIIGGGGITDYKDAIEFLLVGADAVSIGTVNLANPNSAKFILKGITDYMRANKIKDIKELIGGLIE